MSSYDDTQMFTLFGGSNYMSETSEEFQSVEEAAAEWVRRLDDRFFPCWGDGQEPHMFVLQRDNDEELADHWDREETEKLAAVHHARTELAALMANYGRSFGAVGVEDARGSNAGMRGFVLLVMLDQLAASLLEVSEVHSHILK